MAVDGGPDGASVGLPGGPLDGLPAGPLDALVRRAAERWPDQDAIRDAAGTLTFAELESAVESLAARFATEIEPGATVGVTAALSADFAVAYHAVVRAGGVVVTLNPFLRGEVLAHVIESAAMELALVAGPTAAAFAELGDAAPRVLALAGARSGHIAGLGADVDSDAKTRSLPAPDATACIHFTSGTTGRPKGIRQSHRNLTANAAQIAAAHELAEGTAVVNHLPGYHPMHLNSALYAGITQVLFPQDDTPAAIDAANQNHATRFYTLPVRLARLAEHPGLAELRLDTVQAVMSGGTALPPGPAQTLREHFGIPVIQGYGLAEASPLTHNESPSAGRPGSVGRTVAHTECRVVDVDTRAVLPPGGVGEVLVRGPQVMAGYLDPDLPTGLDAEGWLATGDVGRVDEDGYLFLLDRLKEVFKCDDWLVSPSRVENTAARHPAVLECAVVDHADPHHGAVAHCFVVLRPGFGPEALADIRDAANPLLPEPEHIRHITAVPALPRSPQGKVLRRDVRAWTRPGAEIPSSSPANPAGPTSPMNATNATNATNPTRPTNPTHPPNPQEDTMVTLINQLTVVGDADEFEKVSARMSEFMAAQPGYRSHRLLRSLREPNVYVELAEWTDAEAHQTALRSDTFQGFIGELRALVAKPTPGLFADVKAH
jgi:long-chain acyl-CoA synthetase